uniref:Uncharacterized protein n=1 Tax=Streptomyces sp. FR1 TaxID=349971 RepID=V9Z3W4_9ACTN|nr:hypothetical protein pFRL3_445 [Streptomyces sp. FR1]
MAGGWRDFLRARVAEEQRAAEGAGSALGGTRAHAWGVTEAGMPELGVRRGLLCRAVTLTPGWCKGL